MSYKPGVHAPLAARLRPTTLEHFFGQSHLLGAGKPLRRAVEKGELHSMIFWGPPGTGKTTLARLIAGVTQAEFIALSAVMVGVKELRQAVETAKQNRALDGRDTLLFIDEIHRFNKAQQDAFLPFVEDGTVCFIGATTENPSFEVNNALLSRVRVYVLKSLQRDELEQILNRALSDIELGLGERKLALQDEAKQAILDAADGDARHLLLLLEISADMLGADERLITLEHIKELLSGGVRQFDQHGEHFYEQISALHKSLRGSSPDAAIYWLTRMLDGGCDPHYIARRLVRVAMEDIGNADPRALSIAMDAWHALERMGMPEGDLGLYQAALYLACAPKSNAVYVARNRVWKAVKQQGTLPVPMHLRNAPTNMMKNMGYAQGYRYAHDEPEAYAAGENYFPAQMHPETYYQPVNRGLEIKIAQKLDRLNALDAKANNKRQ